MAERPLEVGEDVVGILVRIIFGHDPVALHRRAGVTRITDRHGEAVEGCRESPVGVAVSEAPVAHQVGPDVPVQNRRIRPECRLGVDHGRAGPVANDDEVGTVFRSVAVRCQNDGDGLTDVANTVDRDDARIDRDAQSRHEACCDVNEITAGDDRDDARQGQRGRLVDAEEVGVGVRRPNDRGMQGAGPRAEVVDISATS